jgi:two-component system response regulator ArlR
MDINQHIERYISPSNNWENDTKLNGIGCGGAKQMENVLIVEDEKPIARFLELELQHEGFRVELAYEGRQALEMALQNNYDYILLDLMLPQLNGIEVCRRIRSVKSTPIIMLTARDTVIDRVSGLDSGADDYISKPFAIEEILARIRSIKRRLNKQQEVTYRIADLSMEVDTHQVMRSGKKIELSGREFELLKYMLEHKNIVLTRNSILDRVWDTQFDGETNVIDVYIRYLRAKIDDPFSLKLIHTVRNFGYVLREA